MQELLFLLLPIAAGYGWYMGRRSVQQNQDNQTQQRRDNYFTGLNFLLSDQSEKAVDLFIEMLDGQEDSIDSHLALGSLFRKRGEVDRAIRVHQTLIARPELPHELKQQALLALGKDYLAAGFYDKAEEILLPLLKDHSYKAAVQQLLVDVYQITKDWQKALDIIKDANIKSQGIIASHLYCQLADEQAELKPKAKLFKQALKQDKSCARALIGLIDIDLQQHQLSAAIDKLCQVRDSVPELLIDALPLLKQAFQLADDPDGYASFLTQAIHQHPSASVANALAQELERRGEMEQAEKLILATLYKHPTMRGFQQLMHIKVDQAEEGSGKQSLAMLADLVDQQVKFRPVYKCSSCGFPSHALYWQCPSCKGWGTTLRIRGLDGE